MRNYFTSNKEMKYFKSFILIFFKDTNRCSRITALKRNYNSSGTKIQYKGTK